MNQTENPKCPNCGSKTVPIIYGMPWDPKLYKEAERGDVELGGCVIWFDNPDRVCRGARSHYWQEDEAGALIAAAEDWA